ncbi:ankyrin repeat domain-containing protein [Endozoicomonas sp. 8E]|uniref:ankyrin repeat domain-containing protein n=1 Tax=Endozoicomonas sp. 8E TaxID=3035692 RepID=UPI0029394ECE|nr:ankyrin repeat domain-containing protein [Endozoicomonas sp. 8E]WOG28395.1 ankyrin repeat domain-containing protein [Endozoicomonas sp. 8E]
MDIPKAGIPPFNFDEMRNAVIKDVTTSVIQDEKSEGFSGHMVTTIWLQPQITSQESYAQNSATSIVDRNIDVDAQATSSDGAGQSESRDSFKAQKRRFDDDSDTESQPCKFMASEAIAISNGRHDLESFAESLVKVITDPGSTDADTSEAVRLISVYGADELAKYTCRFSFHTNTTKSYPAITPFALACRFGKLDLVKALYVNQQQLNQTFNIENGTNGRTALMLSVIHGHVNVVAQLLDWGADPLILDEYNHCVDTLNYAFNIDNPDVLIKIEELLTNYRKDKNLPPYKEPKVSMYQIADTGNVNIHVAPDVNHSEFIAKLVEFLESENGQ